MPGTAGKQKSGKRRAVASLPQRKASASSGSNIGISAAANQASDAQKKRAVLMATLKLTVTNLPDDFEDMDEAKLRQKLASLEQELNDYKVKVDLCKHENEKYREEIETSQKDSAEYTAYLTAKRSEKQAIIDKLNHTHLDVMQNHRERKMVLEDQLKTDIANLREEIAVLEAQLDAKNHDILLLPDILAVKYRNENEIIRCKKEIADIESQHHGELMQLERKLLDERIRIERENEIKIVEMGNAAEEQALKYLNDYTQQLGQQNVQLEKELKKSITLTKAYQERKEMLEGRQKELNMEKQVREHIVSARLHQVKKRASKTLDQPKTMMTPNITTKRTSISRQSDYLKQQTVTDIVTHTLPTFENSACLMDMVTDKLKGISL